MLQRLQLLPPIRFRFTAEADAATYGADWWVWDEAEVTRLPARELIALEEAVGMPLVAAIRGFHQDRAHATLAVMWIAMHRAGRKVAWTDFNPAALLADWQEVPAEAPLDSGEDPAPDSASLTAPPESQESATS